MAPLKRHPALVPLSKDHHFGLLLCWKIRQGFANNIEVKRIADYAVWFFENHLKDHFALEEAYVFSLLEEGHPLRELAISQHQQILGFINSLSHDNEKKEDILKSIEALLERHIRMEERELFQEIQNSAGMDKLLQMEAHINNEHHQSPDDWYDPFWIKAKQENVKT